MHVHDYIKQFMDKKICYNCVGETFLKDQILESGEIAICNYCNKNSKSYSIEELADLIETAFNQHYFRTSDEPTSFQSAMMSDKDSQYDWYRDGEEVIDAIANAAEIDTAVAFDIQRILEDKYSELGSDYIGIETEFSSDSHYEISQTNDAHWQAQWRDFESSMRTEARFFSKIAYELLSSVFNGIDKMEGVQNSVSVN